MGVAATLPELSEWTLNHGLVIKNPCFSCKLKIYLQTEFITSIQKISYS